MFENDLSIVPAHDGVGEELNLVAVPALQLVRNPDQVLQVEVGGVLDDTPQVDSPQHIHRLGEASKGLHEGGLGGEGEGLDVEDCGANVPQPGFDE